jgi:glycosyltransferase involved in cell wall biosynthesis
VLVQIGNYLAGLGYQVVFLVARDRCKTPFAFAKGVTVTDVGIHTGIKLIDYAVFLCCVPFCVGRQSVVIANFFVSYYPVRLAALLKHVPYIYFVQDIESKYSFPGGIVLNRLCNWTYHDKRIVAANGHLQNRLMAEFGTASRSIVVGPDRVFYDLPIQSEKKYDVVYFLRREPWKGLDRFLRFLELARGRLSCLCVSQDKQLAAAIAGSDATFRKPKSDTELVECIDSARVLLLTSYEEGFALPPLEGMARGVPTVLFRCGGPDLYVVDGRNSIYVESEDAAIRAVESMVSDPGEYERMSREARATAEGYRMDTSLAYMAELIAHCSEW